MMSFREFAEFAIRLKGRPFSLADRPHLWDLYDCVANNLVVRASRQCEKSTYLVNVILYYAIMHPGVSILFVAPRHDQGALFVRDRLQPAIWNSPLVKAQLWANNARRMPIKDIWFDNGSSLHV